MSLIFCGGEMHSKEYNDVLNLIRELSENIKDTDRQQKQTERLITKLTHQINELTQKTDKQINELTQKTDKQNKVLNKQISALGKQLGGLGQKFGYYTESLALPSMKRILMKEFGVEVVTPRILSRRHNDEMEIDVLGYVNRNINKAYLVEIKSKLNNNEIKSTIKNINRFFKFFPEHQDKELYGIVAAIDYTPLMKQKVLDAGLFFASIHDELFHLDTPKTFVPKKFLFSIK